MVPWRIYPALCASALLLYSPHLIAAAETALSADAGAPSVEPVASEQPVPPVHRSSWESGGFYLSLFGGGAQVEATQVTATSYCPLCIFGSSYTTVSKQVDNWSGSVAGLRAEGWFTKGDGALGFAYEIAQHKASAPEVELSYLATTLMPLAGYTFYRSAAQAGGSARLYAGLMISSLQDGKATVSFAELSSPVSVSSNMEGNGTGLLLGIGGDYARLRLFAELRGVDMSVSGKYLGNEIKLSHDTRQIVVGLGFRLE